VTTLKRRIRELEKALDRTAESLEKTRKAKHKIPAQGKLRTTRGAFVRVFLPDTHGHSVDPAALKACLTDLEYLQPREIFLMGDHLDCGGFLAQHHTLGFVAETDNTFESDVNAANALLDAVQKLCPKASIKYLEGNHEERIEKWIVNSVLRNGADAEFLRRLMGPEAVLHLESRKIPYIRKAVTYDGCRVQGTVKAGNCYITPWHSSREKRR